MTRTQQFNERAKEIELNYLIGLITYKKYLELIKTNVTIYVQRKEILNR